MPLIDDSSATLGANDRTAFLAWQRIAGILRRIATRRADRQWMMEEIGGGEHVGLHGLPEEHRFAAARFAIRACTCSSGIDPYSRGRVHNHLSRHPEPSSDDIDMAREIKAAAEALGAGDASSAGSRELLSKLLGCTAKRYSRNNRRLLRKECIAVSRCDSTSGKCISSAHRWLGHAWWQLRQDIRLSCALRDPKRILVMTMTG